MEQNKLDMFVMTNKKFFPEEKMAEIQSKLAELGEDKEALVTAAQYKDPVVTLIISLFLGGLGVDRFMLGDTGLGIAKLLTCGGCGIWTIIDWFTVMGKTKELNYKKLIEIIG